MRKLKYAIGSVVALALLGAVSACIPGASGGQARNESETLYILAGSEVQDMQPILDEVKAQTGVTLEFTYSGTLDGTELVAKGETSQYDAIWFPSNKYLSLLPGSAGKTGESKSIMQSPISIAVTESKAAELNWTSSTQVEWSAIVQAVKDKKLTFGMTNPGASNSGFSALVAVTTALSGSDTVITEESIDKVAPDLQAFFQGQSLTAGSSGWLNQSYFEDSSGIDAVINYESLNKTLPGTVNIVPSDGNIIADYPFTLLSTANEEKQALYNKVVESLMSPATQQKIMEVTKRRPIDPNVDTKDTFGDQTIFNLAFPNQLSAVQGLLNSYLAELRKPSQMFYLMDTSGSMEGERLAGLRQAFATLTSRDAANSLTAFQAGEEVTVIEFSDRIKSQAKVAVDTEDSLAEIQRAVDGWNARGGTAIYSSLRTTYEQALAAAQENPDKFTSIVLMSDGENVSGDSLDQLMSWLDQNRNSDYKVRVFIIRFGEADSEELQQIADVTGGRLFSDDDLSTVFREIRGYQ